MCGICGIVSVNKQILEAKSELVGNMNSALLHRGPDGEGSYHDQSASLAMRRLSIIDLESGDQPLWNESQTICVFMNGEIYNYKNLRANLETKGHKFTSSSDTEVLPHLYEEYGLDFVKHLKGMFACCIYDLPQKKWIFARDQFGEKPFYYHHKNGVFSYSSEMHSLLQNTRIPRVLNEQALTYYLGAAYIPDPLTLIEDIYTLPPGNVLVLENDQLTIQPYFCINYSVHKEKITDEEEAKDYILPYLQQAVKRQSVSDVPLGAFLSGGIDSSTICALLQKQNQNPIDTFTVKFEEASYDESKIASEVAQRIGSNHHEIVIPNQDFTEDIFWEIVNHVGLPFPDSSAIPVYFISKEIKKHVKVALSGDGGDEIFAGYPVFGWWKKIKKISQLPQWSRKLAISWLNSNTHPFSEERTRQFRRGLAASLKGQEGISLEIHRMFFDDELQKILKEIAALDLNLFLRTPTSFKKYSDLRKSMYHRLKHNLVNDMLIKVDRMSMANSLEVRAPFLDPDLYQASLKLSDHLLYSNGVGKIILREVMADLLPVSVFNHPKSGFSIPLHKYQNEEYQKLSNKLLRKSNPIFKVLDYDFVQQISSQTFSNSIKIRDKSIYRSSHQHWTLLMLAGWIDRYQIQVRD